MLTVNGKADEVLMDTKTYEKHLRASSMMRLPIQAEEDVAAGRTRSMRSFLKEFKHGRKVARYYSITRTAENDIEEAWSFIALIGFQA